MKKITLLIIALALAATQSYSNTRASILLLHNGQGTSFDADQLQMAVDDAVNGDSIILSVGTFPVNGALSINKVITITGIGETTKVMGNINYDIDKSPSMKGYALSCLRINGDVIVAKRLHGLKIKKCWIEGNVYATDSLYDIQIDQSYIKKFAPTSYTINAFIKNSILGEVGPCITGQALSSDNSKITLFNCSIDRIGSNGFGSYLQYITVVNSVIYAYSCSAYSKNNTFINTLKSGTFDTSYGDIVENCYSNSGLKANTVSDKLPTFTLDNKALTTTLLVENGYLGNDNTAVGADGGSTPFSLSIEGLSIKESVLKVDPVTRQLNVTLTVE